MFTKEAFERLRSMADIDDLSPEDFESFSKFFLERIGYQNAALTPKFGELGGDGGVDVTCTLNGQRVLVQCKKWRFGFNGYMKIAPVRELGGCMLRDKAPLGVFIGMLGYDQGTRRDAAKMNIRLIDAAEIASHMRTINPRFNASIKRSILRRIWRALVKLLRGIIGLR